MFWKTRVLPPGQFSIRQQGWVTPGVSRLAPCMTEPVSKLFVASSVNFVSLHLDCFVKNFLMGQIKVWVMKFVVIVNHDVDV